MTILDQLKIKIAAGTAGIVIQSEEYDEVERQIASLAAQEKFRVYVWDCVSGLRALTAETKATPRSTQMPLWHIINEEKRYCESGGKSSQPTLFVYRNVHHYLHGPAEQMAILNAVSDGKQNGYFTILVGPIVQIPPELDRSLSLIRHALPGRDQIETVAKSIYESAGMEWNPKDSEVRMAIEAAMGLTMYEAETIFAECLVTSGKLIPEVVWQTKSRVLEGTGYLQLWRGKETFSDLIGLDGLKTFCLSMLRNPVEDPRLRPRGVMLVGVPGMGKSMFCKALGNATRRPVLVLEVGGLMGSLVGQTESRTQRAIDLAERMAPSILFIDEIEKGLAGASTMADSGVTARLVGKLDKWLGEKTSDVFVVATCNNTKQLEKHHPELVRQGRFDAIFFLDLPSAEHRRKILNLYCNKYKLEDRTLSDAAMDGWTGAEIEACCRLAKVQGRSLEEVSLGIVTMANVMGASLTELREQATGRYLDAHHPSAVVYGSAGRPSFSGRSIRRRE